MATAIFAAIGNVIVPGIGGIIGAIVGAYIDNELLNDEDKPPEIVDLLLPNTTEGGPAISVLGQSARVRGQVVFQSPQFKFGGEDAVDIAMAVQNDGKSINRIRFVYADGFEIYNDDGTVTQTGNDVSLTQVLNHDGLGELFSQHFSLKSVPQSGVNLSRYRPGRRIVGGVDSGLTMFGWNDARNNRSALTDRDVITEMRILADGNIEIILFLRPSLKPPPANEFAGGNQVTITQVFPQANPAFISGYNLQTGAPGQIAPDDSPFKKYTAKPVELEETSWFSLKDFKLTQFGGRLPEILCIVEQSPIPVTITSAIDSIFEQAGWGVTAPPGAESGLQWDATALGADLYVKGYVMREETTVLQRLQPLMIAFDIKSQIRDGQIHFFHSQNARVWEVPESAWGVQAGGEFADGLIFDATTPANEPTKVSVQFADELNFFEDASVERHTSTRGVTSRDELEIDLRSLTMDAAEALVIANRLLWRPQQSSHKFSGSLPPRFWFILENDLIKTVFNDREVILAVAKKDRGQDGSFSLSGSTFEGDPPQTRGLF